MKQAFIFRGPPASGKGTVVENFAKTLPGKVAYLDLDVFRWGFHLAGRQVKDILPDEHRLAFQNLLTVLENYCRQGVYTIVIDGLFTWNDQNSTQGNVQNIVEILKRHEFEYKSIVLTADKNILESRNAAREYIVPSAEFDELYHDVMDYIDPSEKVIDSSHQTPEETLADINRLTP